MALPAFETLLPARAAAVMTKEGAKLATTASGAPLRMAFVYVPNGVHQGYWWPKKEGKDFELNKTLQPLAKVKEKIQLLGGLDQINATAGPMVRATTPEPAARSSRECGSRRPRVRTFMPESRSTRSPPSESAS